MKLIRSLGFMIATLVLAASCGSPQNADPQPDNTPDSTQNTAVVAEQLRFTTETIDGEDFSGESLAGEPAVLWFWAPWCPTCQREAPTVAEAAQAHAEVTFVGVAAQDELPAMKDFVSTYEVDSFVHLADLDASVWQQFGVTAQPAFAFITPDGTVDVVKGTLSEQELTDRAGELAGS